MKERLTKILPLCVDVASQSEISWKELNFDPVDTTDVQRFYNKFCSLGLLKEARVVDIRTDCRQTVRVGSFNKKLNSLTEVRQMRRSRGLLLATYVNCDLQYNLLVSMNFE